MEGLLRALLRVKVTDGDLRAVPRTDALRRQQIISASPMTRWAWDMVDSGEGLVRRNSAAPAVAFNSANVNQRGFGERVPQPDLYSAFDDWAHLMGLRATSREAFGRWFASLGFPYVQINGYRHYDVPDRQAFGRAVLDRAGII